jgi:DNA polymerase-4
LPTGNDPRPVVADNPDKSVGAERTFDSDQGDHAVVVREMLRLAERVAGSLRAKGLRGRTVSIKVRFADFSTITRARTLPTPTDVAHEVYTSARELFLENVGGGAKVRLIGVRLDGLADASASEQLTFVDATAPRWRDAESAAAGARSKFGAGAVHPASLIPSEGEADGGRPG